MVTPTLAAPWPLAPSPRLCPARARGGSCCRTTPATPGCCQGKGPGQGPIFAAFEPVILSPARCTTSAGAGGGAWVYLRSPNRNKGSLEAGGASGSPRPCRGVPAVGGMGSPRQSPISAGTEPPPSCSGHHNVNRAQKREFSPTWLGWGAGGSLVLMGQLRAASGCPSLAPGLVGCTRAQRPWGWACKGQRAYVGVQGAVHVGVQRTGCAQGCARDSAHGRAKERPCTWACKGRRVWACKGQAVCMGVQGPVPAGWGGLCPWAPGSLCLRRLWFTFDPVLYICNQL